MLFQGTFDGLYVYTSPLAPGISYFRLLTARKELLSLNHRLRIVGDLAKALTHKAQFFTDHSFVNTSLSSIKLSVDCFNFRNKDLKRRITAWISKIRPQDAYLAKLPIVLTHMNMTPFNYFVDAASGQVTAILDWDGAKYLPIGHNFHFVGSCWDTATSWWKGQSVAGWYADYKKKLSLSEYTISKKYDCGVGYRVRIPWLETAETTLTEYQRILRNWNFATRVYWRVGERVAGDAVDALRLFVS